MANVSDVDMLMRYTKLIEHGGLVIDPQTKVVVEKTIQDKIGDAKKLAKADIVLVILSQADVSEG